MTSVLIWGDTLGNLDLRHEIPVGMMDPLLLVLHRNQRYVLTSALERDRVLAVAPDVQILDFFTLGYREFRRTGLGEKAAEWETAVRAAKRIGVRSAAVPGDFPVGLADRLRAEGISLTVDDDRFVSRRRAKNGHELDGVRRAQRAADAAMAAAAGLLAQSVAGPDGLAVRDGITLTAETVRRTLRDVCARHDCTLPPDVIVASRLSGHGHEPGSGPLPAGFPITIDIWPQDDRTGAWADMTRTFVIGAPVSPAIAAYLRVVSDALESVRGCVQPGVKGAELMDRCCDVLESAGWETPRTVRSGEVRRGMQFSLGHGVGLQVHESPSLGLGSEDELRVGDVLALEPGLWDEEFGEVRLEDLVLVNEEGCETLGAFPYGLEP